MADAYIIDACRTPRGIGKVGKGSLAHLHPQHLGAAVLAAQKLGMSELIDARPHAVGTIQDTYRKYTHLGPALPAMGYGEQQVRDLEATINATDADVVVFATPVDLRRLVKISKDAVRVRYDLQEIGKPDLEEVLADILAVHERKTPHFDPRLERGRCCGAFALVRRDEAIRRRVPRSAPR